MYPTGSHSLKYLAYWKEAIFDHSMVAANYTVEGVEWSQRLTYSHLVQFPHIFLRQFLKIVDQHTYE